MVFNTEIGSVLDGKYQIIKKIGSGGSAKIYLVRDQMLDTEWAIKQVKLGQLDISEYKREANILKNLRHPALPRVVSVFEDDENVFIVRDFVTGLTLSEYVMKNGSLELDELLDVITQITDILNYLHSRENPVIYRDLKPSNLVYTDDKKVNFIDFGITREFKEGIDNDTIYMGTKGYAAPELFGIAQSDMRTDIYAFGATIYFLFTSNHMAEVPKDELWTLFKTQNAKIIQTIIEKATQFDPNMRYQRVTDILEHISIIRNDYTTEEIRPINSVIGEVSSNQAGEIKSDSKNFTNAKQIYNNLKLTIAVMGYKRGVGSTHVSLCLAKAISNKGYRVNLIDQSDDFGLKLYDKYLDGEDIDSKYSNSCFMAKGIRVLNADSADYTELLQEDCDYNVVDFGNAHYRLNDFLKSQYKLVILPSNSWAYSEGLTFIHELEKYRDIKYIVNLTSEENYSEVAQWLNLNKNLHYFNYQELNFLTDDKMDKLYEDIIGVSDNTITNTYAKKKWKWF